MFGIRYFDAPPGWFFSKNFQHYQKVNRGVYAYVSPLIFGWKAQLYLRGNVSSCELEARTEDVTKEGFMKMISLAEEWLNKYQDGDREKIKEDRFCIYNPNGVWIDSIKKEYWI
jgi:hypothetical protein